MKLFTRKDLAALARNATLPEADRKPVIKLFTPDAGATWLISEIDGDRLFGLCDLVLGFPKLGYVSIEEISSYRGRLNLPIERDRYFKPVKTLSEYAREARIKGGISA